jgi:hypothetical protein
MRSKWFGTNGTRGASGKFVRHNYDPAKTRIEWARSATKHRVSRERSRHVIEHCGGFFEQDPPPEMHDPDPRLVFLGDDEGGIPLEVIAIQVGVSRLVVIHAMRLRNRHRSDYEEASKWRR